MNGGGDGDEGGGDDDESEALSHRGVLRVLQ